MHDLDAASERLALIGRAQWHFADDCFVCSPGWLRIHGCAAAPASRAVLETLAHPDDLPRIRVALDAARHEGAPYEIEHRIVRLDDGVVRHVRAYGMMLRDEAGQPASLAFAVKDVTEQRQTEAALRGERERLANIIAGTHVGTWEWNVQTGVTVFDERWAGIVGYSLAELAPTTVDTWRRLTHPDDLARATAALERHFTHAADHYSVDIRQRHRDGHWVWVRARGEVLRWTPDGRPLQMFGTHLDVTAEKLGEQAVASEHAKYVSLLRKASDGVHILDRGGRLVECSDSFCAMLGYPRETIIGMHVLQWDAVHDAAAVDARLAEQFASQVRVQFETTHRHRDGHLIDVEISGFAWTVDGTTLLFNSSRDISARKAAERALRDSEGRFRALFDHMQSGFALHEIVTDTDGKPVDYIFLAANEAFGRLTGLDAKGVIGRRVTEVYPGIVHDRTDWIGIYGAVALGGEAKHFESFAEGLQRRFDITAYSPQPRQFAVVVNDVTERQLTNQALIESSQFNQQIIASAQEGIIVYGPDLRYQVWNAHMEHFTGMHAEDVIGRHPLEVFPFLQEGGVMDKLHGALAGEMPEAVEFPFTVHQSGRSGWASDRTAPLRNARGEVVGVIATVRDVTDVKRAEQALRELNESLEARVIERTRELAVATQQAEAANRAKSDFLANMSHEIRTPMTTILGMAEMLRFDGVTPGQAGRLDKIDHAARHLLTILDDVLDLAKIEAGKLELAHGPVDLDGLCANVSAMLADRARDKGLVFSIDNRVPRDVLFGDSTRIRQALINYVSNAIKFTERGRIQVSMELREERDDRVLVHFAVADTGIGIAPAAVARLFGPFEQVDNSPTRVHGGTGLGLAIVRKLAGLMGGHAGVDSRPGHGSTFWFTALLQRPAAPAGAPAPLPPPAPAAPPTMRPMPTDAPRRRVLVVDDDATNRQIIVAMLETAALDVDSAGDGREALALASARRYDAILLDLQMPELDGYAAAQRIRAESHNHATPILALTGNALTEVRQRCQAAGMSDFIAKPFTMAALLAAIDRWTGSAKPRPPAV